MNKIDLVPAFKDNRGEIVDLLEHEEINAITLITFAKNAVRANHYHEMTYQWNYVISGRILIASKLPNEEKRELILEPGDLCVTVPNEAHALKALEDSKLLVFTKGPRDGTDYETDTFRLENPLII